MFGTSLRNALRRAGPSRFPLSSPTRGQRRFMSNEPFPFKPPPIRERLRPLIPFFIYWSFITSLAVHLLRLRIRTKEELDKRQAQISVLTTLLERVTRGEAVSESEIGRELEMVGLRKRSSLTRVEGDEMKITGDVRWSEVLFGRKRLSEKDDEAKEEEIIQEWAQVVNQATKSSSSTPTPSSAGSSSPNLPDRPREAKRAPSSNVYM